MLYRYSSTAVTGASIKTEDPLEALSNHVPHQIHVLLFGDASSRGDMDPLSAANTNFQSSLRKVPAVTIYVQSTNPGHERGILFLFSKIAHRMYGLSNYDFFSKEDGCYDTLGVDRAASAYFAYHCFKAPVLVFDGGTALTYTACDAQGKLMGGGISLGILSRFRALSDYCGQLPLIDFEEYNQAVEKIKKGEASTLPVFAMDTKMAMMTSVFQEISLHCQNVILQFLDEVEKRDTNTSGTKENGEETTANAEIHSVTKVLPKVVIAGSDNGFLETLLEKPGLVVRNEMGPSIKKQVDFRGFRNGCHYAVGKLLEINQSQMTNQLSPDEELRARLIGQRVAKEFPVADKDGDKLYRGSVRQVKRGEHLESDLYTVQYDDGDNEDFDFEEIYGESCLSYGYFTFLVFQSSFPQLSTEALRLYIEVGEKDSADPIVLSKKWKEDRKKSAEKSTADLLGQVAGLQEKVTSKAAEKGNETSRQQGSTPSTNISTPKRHLPSESLVPESSAERQRAKVQRLSIYKDFPNLPVAKYFEIVSSEGEMTNILFSGKVVSFDSVFWKVRYEDGDEEEFDEADLRHGALLYLQHFGHTLPQDELQKLVDTFRHKR